MKRTDQLSEIINYYSENCESQSKIAISAAGMATDRRYVISLAHYASHTLMANQIAREIKLKIRSQFTMNVYDEAEIDVPNTTSPNLTLSKQNQLYFSPIINSIPEGQSQQNYLDRRHALRTHGPQIFNVELSRLSIVASRSRRPIDPHRFVTWPLSLNIPQLSETGMIQVEMIIPNEKRNCFVFDSNGLRSLRLKQQDLNEKDQNSKLLCKTIIIRWVEKLKVRFLNSILVLDLLGHLQDYMISVEPWMGPIMLISLLLSTVIRKNIKVSKP